MLETVRVVRNDLTEADTELVVLKAKQGHSGGEGEGDGAGERAATIADCGEVIYVGAIPMSAWSSFGRAVVGVMSGYFHRSVLLKEVVLALAPRPGGRVVDATLGGGGHAEAILEASSPSGWLYGFDRDEAAVIGVAGAVGAVFGAIRVSAGQPGGAGGLD